MDTNIKIDDHCVVIEKNLQTKNVSFTYTKSSKFSYPFILMVLVSERMKSTKKHIRTAVNVTAY